MRRQWPLPFYHRFSVHICVKTQHKVLYGVLLKGCMIHSYDMIFVCTVLYYVL